MNKKPLAFSAIFILCLIAGCGKTNEIEVSSTIIDHEIETTTIPEETTTEKELTIYDYSVEELAEMVLNGEFGAGQDRIDALGDRYDEVQDYIDMNYISDNYPYEVEEAVVPDYSSEYSAEDLKYLGVIYWGGYKFTWYSELVLPGGGLNIPGRWSDGDFVRDGNGNICVASSDMPYGTIVSTPWGQGVVYDSGCANGTIDIYTSW